MIMAVVVLVLTLIARSTEENAVVLVVLPIMLLAAISLVVIDILAYREDKKNGKQPGFATFIRSISLVVTTLLFVAAVLINTIL